MRFVSENRQMTNKKLYCEDVLRILLADSDSEGNDDRPSNDRASPGTSMLRNGAAGHGKSVHKAQTIDNFGHLPNGVHRRGSVLLMIAPDCVFFLIVRAQRATGREYRCSQCWVTLGLCAVPCNERYHTLKNYKLLPKYLIGQIAGQLIKK